MNQPTVEQFESFIRDSFSRHGLPLDRCSQILFSQLAHMPNYGIFNFPFQYAEQEIGYLEGKGKTSTKPAEPFSEKGKLRGLMHKHFLVSGPEQLAANAKLAWKLDNPNSGKFSQMASRVRKPYANCTPTQTEARNLSKELTDEFMGGLKERLAGKATGDWIVYLPHQGKNYYLCIAKHDEDDFILEAVKRCCTEFSFIPAHVAL